MPAYTGLLLSRQHDNGLRLWSVTKVGVETPQGTASDMTDPIQSGRSGKFTDTEPLQTSHRYERDLSAGIA